MDGDAIAARWARVRVARDGGARARCARVGARCVAGVSEARGGELGRGGRRRRSLARGRRGDGLEG
eukprot:3516405-Pleurochrysis_carterae.AAC.1